jgi:putative transposase
MPGSYTQLLYHLVFSTKKRRPLIDASLREPLHDYMGGIVRGMKHCDLLEIGGVADHVHILVRLHASIALGDALRVCKASSSKWANERVKQKGWFEWQEGYAAFTVSQAQLARLSAYILNQEQHHRRQDFRSELITLLKKHGIKFEEQYLD